MVCVYLEVADGFFLEGDSSLRCGDFNIVSLPEAIHHWIVKTTETAGLFEVFLEFSF